MDNFSYCTEEMLNALRKNKQVFLVPKESEDPRSLMRAYVVYFNFLEEFGYNWDAFNDCVCSYDDFSQHNVRILHFDVPLQSSSRDQKIYLRILNRSVDFWRKPDLAEHHNVAIYFPESCRSEIAKVLDS